jgi:alkanesulfonate monooxygenase SsuD/methylene tetrahydromethanopterin reductase-like flavin-dependent oxidoreductase (luciferase family)
VTHPISLTAPQFANRPDSTFELARSAGSLGLTGIFLFDHLVPLGDPYRPVLEGAATLGAVAATTATRIGSLVTRVTLRDPSITAAIGTTLAGIAPGRSILGLGVGDRMSEGEAVRFGMIRPGLAERIGLLEATIELTRLAAPDLPIWVGGRHPRIRRIASARADGWNAWGAVAGDFSQEAQEVRSTATRPITVSWGGGVILALDQVALDAEVAARGGPEAILQSGLTAGTAAQIVDHLASIAMIADEIVVSVLPNTPDNWLRFAQEVLPLL